MSILTVRWVYVTFAPRSNPLRTTPLNRDNQLFKFRKIKNKKEFSLSLLPDAFRLLPSVGRGNVFNPQDTAKLVKLLADAHSESALVKALKDVELDEFLELMGPKSWESVCEAYLILEHDFVPTGLRIGGTLPNFDIVGRCSKDGARILAQCKKKPDPVEIGEDFLKVIGRPDTDSGEGNKLRVFYFAYSGCAGAVPQEITVIDIATMRNWAATEVGRKYFRWVKGE